MRTLLQLSMLVLASGTLTVRSFGQHHEDHSAHAVHQETRNSNLGPNGGTLQHVGDFTVETVIMPKGIMFLVSDQQGNVVQAPQAAGELTLTVGESDRKYQYPLALLKNHALGVAVDLSKVEGQMLHLDVKLDGIGEQPIQFHATSKNERGLPDAVLMSLQKTCPVSGQPLGSMGAPPKIMLNDKALFVCCAACTDRVKANPEAYLAKYYQANGSEVRPGVFEATLADVVAIAAQKNCPVMDEPLGGMGAPQKVNVKGKAVYICCAGCAKKLDAEPDKYLSKLAQEGVTPPDFK